VKSTPPSEPSFEEALEKLEGLVSNMECGEIPLEQMVQQFEDATRLLYSCADKLRSAEQRLEVLKQERRGFVFEKLNPPET
jgi:exodeoxyribonuclease VII small subunit